MPNRFRMSEDELAHNQAKHERLQEPGRKAVEMIEAGIDMVLADLGVDLDKPFPPQQAELQIIIMENSDERMPKATGFYIFQLRDGSPVPIAWVGDARMDNDGKAWIDIEWFNRGIREEVGGIKVI